MCLRWHRRRWMSNGEGVCECLIAIARRGARKYLRNNSLLVFRCVRVTAGLSFSTHYYSSRDERASATKKKKERIEESIPRPSLYLCMSLSLNSSWEIRLNVFADRQKYFAKARANAPLKMEKCHESKSRGKKLHGEGCVLHRGYEFLDSASPSIFFSFLIKYAAVSKKWREMSRRESRCDLDLDARWSFTKKEGFTEISKCLSLIQRQLIFFAAQAINLLTV